MLLVGVCAWAQTVVTAINTEKYYTLECRSGVAHSTNRFIGDDGTVINGNSALAAFLVFEAADGVENGYYIKSVASNRYLNHDGTNISASTEKSTVWTLGVGGKEHVDNVVTFTIGNDKYLNNVGSDCTDGTCASLKANYHSGGPGSGNACSLWEMCEYDEIVATYDVTYSFKYEGVEKYSETITVNEGAEYPNYTIALPYGVVAAAKPAGTVGADITCDVALTIEKELPFAYAEDYKSITNWYYLNIRDDGPTYMYYDANVSYIKATEKVVPEDEDKKDAYTWGFIGNVFEGFSIVNYAAGETMVLSSPKAPTGNQNEAELARMVVKEGAAGNLVWNIAAPIHGGAAGAFYVVHPTAKSYAFNRQDYNGAKTVCYWNGRDTGSAVQVVERPMTLAAELQFLIDEAKENVATNAGGKIGDYTQESIEALNAAIAVAEGKIETATKEDVAALQTAMDAVVVILPTVGKYYQFRNANAKFSATMAAYSAETGAPRWKALDEADKSFYWEAVATADGGVALKNAASGKYLQGNANQSGEWALSEDEAKISVVVLSREENVNGYQCSVVLAGWQMHAADHGGGQGTDGRIVSYNSQANDASAWFIVEAELPSPETSIEEVSVEAAPVIYDLTGRRVEKMEKGIYIVNGRKVVIK